MIQYICSSLQPPLTGGSNIGPLKGNSCEGQSNSKSSVESGISARIRMELRIKRRILVTLPNRFRGRLGTDYVLSITGGSIHNPKCNCNRLLQRSFPLRINKMRTCAEVTAIFQGKPSKCLSTTDGVSGKGRIFHSHS
jgi:hypothetical protein